MEYFLLHLCPWTTYWASRVFPWKQLVTASSWAGEQHRPPGTELFRCRDCGSLPRILVGCRTYGGSLVMMGREGNGTPLQYSCLENPRDRGAWWAAIYGVAQSWTRLKRLSSSSSSSDDGKKREERSRGTEGKERSFCIISVFI